MKKILIIGTIPPPVGGVTVHVFRLIQKIEEEQLPVQYISFRRKFLFILSVLRYKVIHLHTSSPLVQFLMTLFCFLTFKKLIVTFHGNLERYLNMNQLYNCLIRLSIFFAKYPIVLNEESYQIARKINKNTLLISAFIPPAKEALDIHIDNLIDTLREKNRILFSTNAFDVAFLNNREIYGISQLVDLFHKIENACLIVSDPSGNYLSYLKDTLKQFIPDNVIFISYPHNYYELLKKIDVMIRATCSDGDSLSIKEALYLGKKVICSDVVSRPQGVFLYNYNDKEALFNLINSINELDPQTDPTVDAESFDGSIRLIQLYKQLLQ